MVPGGCCLAASQLQTCPAHRGGFGHPPASAQTAGSGEDHCCRKQSPSVWSASVFATENLVCTDTSSATVLLWAQPWPPSSRGWSCPAPHQMPAGRPALPWPLTVGRPCKCRRAASACNVLHVLSPQASGLKICPVKAFCSLPPHAWSHLFNGTLPFTQKVAILHDP